VAVCIQKNLYFFAKIKFFLYVSDYFGLKNNFLKIKKHHFDAFQHKKHFKKQSQPHFQVRKATSFRERPKPNPKYLGWSGREWRRCSHGQVENKKSAILDWVFCSWEFHIIVESFTCLCFPVACYFHLLCSIFLTCLKFQLLATNFPLFSAFLYVALLI
jgi:hypothetical protein